MKNTEINDVPKGAKNTFERCLDNMCSRIGDFWVSAVMLGIGIGAAVLPTVPDMKQAQFMTSVVGIFIGLAGLVSKSKKTTED